MTRGAWWVALGLLVGGVTGLLAFAPATWLASAVASATSQQLLLTDARGTVWRGDAVLVLSGGEGSRAAVALPGRLSWRMQWQGSDIELQAQQACCLNDNFRLRVAPGLGRVTLRLMPVQGAVGQWPVSLLAGLGAPWNTLQLGGVMRLHSSGAVLDSAQGRLAYSGHAELRVDGLSSRLSSLPTLGSYSLAVDGQAQAGDSAALTLTTTRGPLLLSGAGQWGGGGGVGNAVGAGGAAGHTRLRFRGEARVAPDAPEAVNALSNLLNVIGRREGALSILSIG